VKIVQLWQETFVELAIRTYQLEYQPYPNGPTEKKMVTVETLSSFEPNALGAIDVGSGWLGVRWLRDFHPVEWHAVPAGTGETLPGEMTFQMADEPPTRIAPHVRMSEALLLPPPEVLLPELRTRMVAHLTNNLKATVIDAERP
jgi:hypothetical protein